MKKVFGMILFAFVFLTQGVYADNSKIEVSCDAFYVCLNNDEVQQKVIEKGIFRYKHPRGAEFGVVSISLKAGGVAEAANGKGSTSGRWELKDGIISFKSKEWGEVAFRFIRINDKTFVFFTPFVALIPVEIAGA